MANDAKEVARAHLADAGVVELPDEWDVVTLGDLFTEDRGIAVGVMYPGDHDPNGVPLIKAGDLNGSIINPQPDFRITKEKHHEYRRTALEGGELVMTLVGNVGQCAVVPPRMAGWNAARAVAVMRLVDPTETHFVQQCLLSRPLQHLMDVWCNTTVQATLNLKEIRQLPLPWPPKRSRDAIAAFGKALDAKIELNRWMNATLEAMARALFQSWFVDFDPVRAKLDGRQPSGLDQPTADLFPDGFQESPLGPIPKGWRYARLREIADVSSGGTPKRDVASYWDGDIPWISPKSMMQIHVDDSEDHVREAAIGNGTRLVPKGSTLVMVRGMGLHQGVRISQAQRDVTFNQDVKAVKATSVPDTLLFYGLLNSATDLLTKVHASGHGTGVLSTEFLDNLSFAVPSSESIEALTKPMQSMNAALDLNNRQSRTLATLRDTLLPKLLSGELRAPCVDLLARGTR